MNERNARSPLTPDCCFVYGTLLRGFGNHPILCRLGGQFLGEAISVRPFPLVVTDLPYLLDHPGEGFLVEGEIYRIPETGWERLDRLEGHPHFYFRRVEEFELNGEIVRSWTYFLARETPELRRMKPVGRFGEGSGDRSLT